MGASPNLVRPCVSTKRSQRCFLRAENESGTLSGPWASRLPWLTPWGEVTQPLPQVPCLQKGPGSVPREARVASPAGCARIMGLRILLLFLLPPMLLELLAGEEPEGKSQRKRLEGKDRVSLCTGLGAPAGVMRALSLGLELAGSDLGDQWGGSREAGSLCQLMREARMVPG